MEQIAYGPLALQPRQFWALTPAEFVSLCAGYRWREDHTMAHLAWQTAYLLQPWGFSGSARELLGKPDATAEETAFDAALGVTPSYEQVMALQREKGLAKSG
jgi:hypothetical protein